MFLVLQLWIELFQIPQTMGNKVRRKIVEVILSPLFFLRIFLYKIGND